MTTTRPGTWHVLRNGTVLLEAPGPGSDRSVFTQLQAARSLQRHDLEAYDARAPDTDRRESRWGRAFVGSAVLSVLLPVVVVIGFVLLRFDSGAGVGAVLLWVGIPLTLVAWIGTRVAASRMLSVSKRSEREAGLAPGMVSEISSERAHDLMAEHGVTFSLPQRRSTA